MTTIGAGGDGFPKVGESSLIDASRFRLLVYKLMKEGRRTWYEPLWDDILCHSEKSNGFKIRSIWMADMSD